MAFSFSTWSIRNPVPPLLLFALLAVMGLFAYARLPVTAMPAIVTSDVDVVVLQPGATPAELEMETTRRIEDAVASLPGVRKVSSSITEGQSSTRVEFDLGVNVDRAMNDVRNAVAAIRQNLPATVREPIVQRADDTGRPVGIYIAEAPEMPVPELSWFVDDTVARTLKSITGVSRVDRSGGADQEIAIELDPVRLASLGITAADVSHQLSATNINYPGGRLTLGGTEYALRTIGRAATLEQLAQSRVAVAGGREVRLSDLGTVAFGESDMRSITRVDGRPAISFKVFKEQGFSEVEIARAVREKLDALTAKHGVKFTLGYSEVEFVETSYRSTLFNFLEGAVLTVLVVFLFLRDWRTTAMAAVAIPLSVIPTFLAMQWFGFTLNFVSLLSITLVTGVLVDDAIVEIENIHRHMRQGKSAYQAAIEAADEIGLSVIATTLVICAVFVPVSFMEGLPGLFFRQFGLTVAVAAFFSLLVARLLTPMMASRLLREPRHAEPAESPALVHYLRIVEWTLKHRVKTMCVVLLCLLLSFGLVPLLPTGFMPYDDYSLTSATLEMPRGSTIEQTDTATQKVAAILKRHPEVEYVVTTVGETNGAINQARIYAKLVPPRDRALSEREFSRKVYAEVAGMPDVRIGFDSFTGQKDVSIALVSEDPAALSRAADTLKQQMRGIAGLTGVDSNEGQKQPEVVVTMDLVKAAEFGITTQQVGEAISVSTIGDDLPRLSRLNLLDREIPVRVRIPREFGQDLGTLQNLKLRTAAGDTVPLSSVARLSFAQGPVAIERYQRQRRINVEANLDGIALGTALERIEALPAMKALPRGVQVLNTGDAEFMQDLMMGFLRALGAGLLMVYGIQVLLYRDWLQPLARMMALPLSVGGAFLLLFVTGMELSMPALLGMLMLMGIADKNSILLVDAMLEQTRSGVPRQTAILAACRLRARPIVMTSMAMTAGMLPIAAGISLDSAFRGPMAIAVIGGLLSSTVLSLVFVPVLFSYVDDFEHWLAAKLRRESHAPIEARQVS